jgi:hypothetical protein
LTPEALKLPDGREIEFVPMPPDDQFAQIFRSSCRRPATPDELAIVDSYTVNVGLSGPGGAMDDALTMMRAGAAIVRAGGAGVFIDNSALAHGGNDWIELADDGGPDALSFGFVTIVTGTSKFWTMGMHVLGFPDLEMQHADGDEETIIESLRYLCKSDKPISNGDLLADEHGPKFQAIATASEKFGTDSPMHNPWGRLVLKSIKSIAESN